MVVGDGGGGGRVGVVVEGGAGPRGRDVIENVKLK